MKEISRLLTERGSCVGNTSSKNNNVHKYIRVARGWDGMEPMSFIVLMLIMRGMLKYVHDVKSVRGIVMSVGTWVKTKGRKIMGLKESCGKDEEKE